MRGLNLVATLVGVGLLAGCACATRPTQHGHDGGAVTADPSPNGAAAQIMKLDAEFSAATTARGVEGWVWYFAPDGIQMGNDGTTYTGHDAIRAHMTPVFADPDFHLEWAPVGGEVSAGGRIGYTWGRYRGHYRSEGRMQEMAGAYVTVWKLQPDGTWKISFDAGDPDRK